MLMNNITIIGTSHISPQSIKKVEKIVEETKPDLICLELDKQRFMSLLKQDKNNKETNNKNNKKTRKKYPPISQVGLAGFLFAVIASYIQKKLGGKLNMIPGVDMLSAYKIAQKNNINIALIDQNINTTLRNFSRISLKEKLKMVFDLIFGFLILPFSFFIPKNKKTSINIKKIPSKKQISMLINELKKRYPQTFKVLIDDRNKVMAQKLFFLSKKFNHVVAVVGAGHEEGIEKYLDELEKNIKT